MNRVIILHGNAGTKGTDNWYPYIKKGLNGVGICCETPDLPDSKLARKKYWLPYFKNVLNIGREDLIVGHSSGAVAILRYAEENMIGASILVAAMHTDLGFDTERQSGYYDSPWQWDKIRANQEWTAIFASTDDPWIPISQPEFIRDQLGSEFIKFTNKGHFGSVRVPEYEFPELLEFIKNKMKA